MFYLYLVVKQLILPPGLLLVWLGVGLGLALTRYRRFGHALIAAAIVVFYLLSAPFVAARLARLSDTIPPLAANAGTGAEAIVILSAGTSLYAPEYGGPTVDSMTLQRLRYGAELYRHRPLPILVTGGLPLGSRIPLAVMMKEVLETNFRTPVTWVESRARDTFENATLSAAMLLPQGIDHVLLITHAAHMERALKVFEGAGFQVTPAPTGFTAPSRTFPLDYLPRESGLEHSFYAIYELIGRAWYRLRIRNEPAVQP